MELKLFAAIDCLNKNLIKMFKLDYLKMVDLENSYRIQIFSELFLQSIPMSFIIISS